VPSGNGGGRFAGNPVAGGTMGLLRRMVVGVLLAVVSLSYSSVPDVLGQGTSLVSAIGAWDNTYWGTLTDIETADPQIRDGGYSWVRTAVQYNPSGGPNYFAEVGWMKHADGSITAHIASLDPNLTDPFEMDYPSYSPGVGSTHRYIVNWDGGVNAYDLFYDGNYITSRQAFYGTITRTISGGEASSSANAMGVSGCLNNYYQAVNGDPNSWTAYPSHYDQAASGYTVAYLSPNAWQVYGNN
jgi:hypothetical protein